MSVPSACGRRTATRAVGLAAAATVLGCTGERASRVSRPSASAASQHPSGRLVFRADPDRPPDENGRRGTFDVAVGGGRAAAFHVPDLAGPLRLVLLLHGAGGEPARTLRLLLPYAEEHGLLLVAPASRRATWDVLAGGFGPDVRTVDEVLRRTAADYRITGRTVAGFSDGASYALTLGISNGDVFDSVVAFSPGFVAAQVEHGRPRCFVSHGVDDRVLPIDVCSRRIVPRLEEQGYDVTYEEFPGGHEVPVSIRDRAVRWLA